MKSQPRRAGSFGGAAEADTEVLLSQMPEGREGARSPPVSSVGVRNPSQWSFQLKNTLKTPLDYFEPNYVTLGERNKKEKEKVLNFHPNDTNQYG